MAAKKIKGFYYTLYKRSYKNGKLIWEDNEGYLFREEMWRTKIKPEDLGEEFLQVYLYGSHNYLNTKGVTHVIYHPNYIFNHVYKDDTIYISYHGQMTMAERKSSRDYYDITGCDIIMGGSDIVKVAKAIEKNSGIDMSGILKVMNEKQSWFDKTFPDGYKRIGETDFEQHYYEAKKEK